MFKLPKLSIALLLIIISSLIMTACNSDSASNLNESNSNLNPESNEQVSNVDVEGLPPLPHYIKEKGKLVVGVKEDVPPMGFLDESGTNVGYEVDIAHRLAEYAFGDPNAIEFTGTTTPNRVPYLNTEKIDLVIATMGVTEDRKKEVDFSTVYWKSGGMMMVNEDSELTSMDELDGKKAIVITGSIYDINLAEEQPNVELVKFDSTSNALKALKDGRGDAFIHDTILLYDLAKSPDFKVVGDIISLSEGSAAAVRKGDEELLAWVDAAMEKMAEEDLFYSLIDKWIEDDVENVGVSLVDLLSSTVPRPSN